MNEGVLAPSRAGPGPEVGDAPGFLADGGEAGALMRAFDWAATPLGLANDWPPPLKTLVAVMLGANQPMLIVWGAARITLYNDGYAAMCGNRHPRALGRPFEQLWFDIWDQIEPILARAYAGEGTHMDDIMFMMHRNGFPEEAHFAFSYTPVRGEGEAILGMFCACTETTAHVLADRRRAQDAAMQREMFQRAPGFIAILRGPDHVFEFVNEAYQRLTGARPLLGRAVREAMPDVAGQGFFELLDGVYATGERVVADDVPIRLQRKADAPAEERFVAFVYEPMRDETGAVTGVFVEGHDVTDAHRSRQALRESEEHYRHAAELNPQVAWTATPDGQLDRVAERWREWTGTSGLGDTWGQGLHPEDLQSSIDAWVRSIGTGEPYDIEHRVKMRAGGYRWARSRAFPRRDADGAIVKWYGATEDIHEQRQADAELRESEARLRAITDNLPGGMVYQIATGKDGEDRRFLYVSRSHEKLTGVPAAAVLADAGVAYDMILPEDRPALAAAEAASIAQMKPFDVEARFRRADGALRWCRILSAPRAQPDGSVIWDGIQIDITEQKLAEVALRESEARFRGVAEAMPGFVWTAAADGRLDYTSPRWAEYAGDSDDAARGEGWATFLHDEDRDHASLVWRAALAAGSLYEVEFRLRRRDGVYRWWLVRAVPVRDEGGAVVRWIGSAADIDAIVAARDVLARSREELDRRVAERTAELEQAQEALRQSQKLEAMGQLTGGVAHDFNNLLSPIIGGLDLLQRRGLGDERERRLIGGALQSAERAKTLVQRLLAFARRQPLQPSAVDVARLIAGMADLVASTSGPQVRLKVDAPGGLPAARADPNQLEMAILNLSVNARDAMPDGGTLTIAVAGEVVGPGHRAGLAPGDYVRLSVADSGLGMDEATLKRAIEPFFSTKGVGKGTGLGLSMVHGLAAQLGGGFALSSKPGLGTNVELWLPVSEAPAIAAAAGAAPAAGGTAIGTALLVDDEELVRTSTADMLAELGYEVLEAASGAAALALLDAGQAIDVLVSDHLMPGMTGADLARAVRERRPHTPVLIVSGYAEAEGIAPDLPRLTKPFRHADLAAAIGSLMDSAAPAS